MTTLKTNTGRDEVSAAATEGSGKASRKADMPQRGTTPSWDEMMMDYAAIEKKAQEMRAEVAWSIAGAVREWAAAKFGQRKAKAAEAARTRYQRRGQLT